MGSKKRRTKDSAARSLLNKEIREIKNLIVVCALASVIGCGGQLGSDVSTSPNTQVKLPVTVFAATSQCTELEENVYGFCDPGVKALRLSNFVSNSSKKASMLNVDVRYRFPCVQHGGKFQASIAIGTDTKTVGPSDNTEEIVSFQVASEGLADTLSVNVIPDAVASKVAKSCQWTLEAVSISLKLSKNDLAVIAEAKSYIDVVRSQLPIKTREIITYQRKMVETAGSEFSYSCMIKNYQGNILFEGVATELVDRYRIVYGREYDHNRYDCSANMPDDLSKVIEECSKGELSPFCAYYELYKGASIWLKDNIRQIESFSEKLPDDQTLRKLSTLHEELALYLKKSEASVVNK